MLWGVYQVVEQVAEVHHGLPQVLSRRIAAFGNLAIKANTMILPTNAADVAGMIATAMSVIRAPAPK